MKRFSLVLALVLLLSMTVAGTAYANFGPHGGYTNDTDACAGCHRAHTSFSSVTWDDSTASPTSHTALLVGSASTMTEFCNSCHGDNAPGASTNVASGIFDSGPSGASGIATGSPSGTTSTDANGGNKVDGGNVTVAYKTSSQFNAPLNGGGFDRMPDPYAWQSSASVVYKSTSSAHNMDAVGVLWGAGNAATQTMNLDCTSCHDPHGSSNYRLLKAQVNNVTVGGYLSDNVTPNPFVVSNEPGYPAGGWLKHQAGADQMANYRPNYTETTSTPILHQDAAGNKTLSVWCSACHTQYDVREGNNAANGGVTGTYNYDVANAPTGTHTGANAFEPTGIGAKVRHRHPVDVTMENGTGPTKILAEEVVSGLDGNTNWVPLEHNTNTGAGFKDQWIGCLTCHRAHGSSVEETGYAAAHLSQNASGTWAPVRDGIPGVNPVKDSTLLRADNRGVCERCHNK